MEPVVYIMLWERPLRPEERGYLAALLPEVRRARLERVPQDRWDQPLAAWGLLALSCRELFGWKRLPEIEVRQGGKPQFSGYPDRSFSLSHTRGAAACALWDRPIGVDVEGRRKVSRRLMERFGVKEEEDFVRRWVCREAAAKRLGVGGLAALLSPVEGEAECRLLTLEAGLYLGIATEGEARLEQLTWRDLMSRLADCF